MRDVKGKYRKEVLRCIVAVIKFISERHLAFRGWMNTWAHQVMAVSSELGTLELFARFDLFLGEHIERYGQKGQWTRSCPWSTLCDEFCSLIGERVKNTIVVKLQHANYFSVIVDTTPRHWPVDTYFQICQQRGRMWCRFIGFEPIHSHTGASLAECVIRMVHDLELGFEHQMNSETSV